MSDETAAPSPGEELFHEWLDRFREADQAGQDVDLEEFLAPHPAELHDEVRGLVARYDELRQKLGAGPAPTEAGRVVGDFELVRELGRGGIGVVWEAHQVSLKRRVALKLLSPFFSLAESSLQRFLREAEAGARLTHPRIVRVLAVGDDAGLHFIAQELIEGGRTLADAIREVRQQKELAPDYYTKLVLTFAEVAEALAHAHEQGVVHRDIKPSNILLTAEGEPKVADFGLARLDDSSELSRTGDVLGTPCYMSPEQIVAHWKEIDARTDVFSLGATLYEALTLWRPFDGDTSQQIFAKIQTLDPPDPVMVRSRVPRDLAIVCMKALEKRREDRYESMAAFAADLRRISRHEPIVARPPGPLARAGKWARRNPIISVAGSVGTVSLIVIVAMLFVISAERDESIAQRERAEWNSYRAGIEPALAALETQSFDRAERLLANCPEHLRGWEWWHAASWLTRSVAITEHDLGTVRGLAFSPNGERFVSVSMPISADALIQVWEADTGRHVANLKGTDSKPEAVLFTRNGRWIITGMTEYRNATEQQYGSVCLWDGRTYELEVEWEAQGRRIEALALSGDERVLATAGNDGIKLWELATQALLVEIPDERLISAIALNGDGSLVAAGEKKVAVLRVWNAATPGSPREMRDLEGPVTALAFEPSGPRIFAGTAAGAISICHAETGEVLAVHREHPGSVDALVVGREGTRVVSTSAGGDVRAWDLDGAPVEGSTGRWNDSDLLWRRDSPISAVAYDSTRGRVVTGSVDGLVQVLDAYPDEPTGVLLIPAARLTCVAFDPTSRRVAAGSQNGTVFVWDVESRLLLGQHTPASELAQEDPDRIIHSVAFTRAGQLFVEARSGSLHVHPPEFAGPPLELSQAKRTVSCAVIDPEGRWIVTSSAEGLVVIDASSGALLRTLASERIVALAVSADARMLAAASRSGGLLAWSTSDWSVIAEAEAQGYVSSLSIRARDGMVAAAVGTGILTWDVRGDAGIALVGRHDAFVMGVAFAPAFGANGFERIFSACDDGRIGIWDPASHSVREVTLGGHTGSVQGVATSSAGLVATASADGTVRIWGTRLGSGRPWSLR